MNILAIQSYNRPQYNRLSFEGRGKPIDLKYILEKRAYLLPKRVKEEAELAIKTTPEKSLLEIHRSAYKQLLDCETLEIAKRSYPEFEQILEEVPFARKSVYSDRFKERAGENFPLKMLQELWAKLKDKDTVAQELGMTSRSSIDWALKQINFVYFSSAYKKLLQASDAEGNRLIASKTQAWNALHPDLMYARNRHAAQGCKTPEYRLEQSKRIKAHDREHPERRMRISEFDRRVWELCPDVREAMSRFAKGESPYTASIIKKAKSGMDLSPKETRIHKAFFKRFWTAYPEHRETYRLAKEQVRAEMKKK